MANDFITGLLPVLSRPLGPEFNVFDVMHHGLHEKQISNVFRWLLAVDGTHGLDDRFVRIFVDEVNRARPGDEPFVSTGYWVGQERNTAVGDEDTDIADLVLESDDAVLVIENYYTSDGHGHSYANYLRYSQRDGKRGAVVLLSRDIDRARQTQRWEEAVVVTYGRLADRLVESLSTDHVYQRNNAAAYWFIEQLRHKFSQGGRSMNDQTVLDFVVAMCSTGEAHRYGTQRNERAAEQFASDLADQARERFGEGRELLLTAKQQLRSFSEQVLALQLSESVGGELVRAVSSNFQGVYQWTVNLDLEAAEPGPGQSRIQLKFGPSAWHAIERDPNWADAFDSPPPEYSQIFLTYAGGKRIRQSAVSLREVLEGLSSDDRRLHEEVLSLLDRSL
ncbi:PD-(D/E)XK nuclease family protein [Agrococcus sp. KRD186]|uniref:PD-(D/E)XK nuclease family protein n=1 Tax=Agrococcus sp. KRD186 TaxID=2729730 RepID=UPI0019D2716D|nr:PD-(D/E)XK nuclease family protein [Agrococcus sp. KRD186]